MHVVVSLWLLFVFAGVGLPLTRLALGRNAVAGSLVAVALGASLVSYLVLAIGLLGILDFAVVVAMFAILSVLSLLVLSRYRADPGLSELRDFAVPRRSSGIIGVIFVAVPAMMLIGLVGALAYPTAMDALNYHLAFAKIFSQHHRVGFLPTMFYSASTLGTEMLAAAAMVISDDRAAQLVMHFFGWLVLLAVFVTGKKLMDRRSALISVIAFSSVTCFWQVFGDAKNDMHAAFLGALAALFFLLWLKEATGRYLYVAYLFAGLAATIKYFALGLPASIFIAGMLFHPEPGARLSHRLRPQVAGAALSLLVCLPWYVKAFVWTGNPVYPFFSNLFSNPYWNDIMQYRFAIVRSLYVPVSLANFLRSPFDITFHPEWFLARIGPLLLSLIPLLVLVRHWPRWVKGAVTAFSVYYVLWFVFLRDARYLLPMIPMICPAVAYGVVRLSRSSRLLHGLVVGAMASAVAANLLAGVKLHYQKLPAVLGLQSRDEFYATITETSRIDPGSGRYTKVVPEYHFLNKVNELTPADAKIALFSWDVAFYYYFLDREYMLLLPLRQNVLDFAEETSGELMFSRLRELGITHVITDVGPSLQIPQDSLLLTEAPFSEVAVGVDAFVNVLKERTTVLYVEDQYVLYGLNL